MGDFSRFTVRGSRFKVGFAVLGSCPAATEPRIANLEL
jgi:hypothetical protein